MGVGERGGKVTSSETIFKHEGLVPTKPVLSTYIASLGGEKCPLNI